MDAIIKYPRTPHVVGSRHGEGDDLGDIVLSELVGHINAGATVVIEEKLDGANSAISFVDNKLRLQSRGHVLAGGGREEQFSRLKTWAATFTRELHDLLGNRYIMYGEWMHAWHTVYYDALPHEFCEFDIFDTEQQLFLSTSARRKMLDGTGVVSVPVIGELEADIRAKLSDLISASTARSPKWREVFERNVRAAGLDVDITTRRVDPSPLAEGLYLKVELGDETIGRAKFVRGDFVSKITEGGNGGHWSNRSIVANQCADPDRMWEPW